MHFEFATKTKHGMEVIRESKRGLREKENGGKKKTHTKRREEGSVLYVQKICT